MIHYLTFFDLRHSHLILSERVFTELAAMYSNPIQTKAIALFIFVSLYLCQNVVQGEESKLKLKKQKNNPPRIAAIVTEYRPWSHADVIVGRLIQGYRLETTPFYPKVKVHALYVDQTPKDDLSVPLSIKYGVPIKKSIREAILDQNGKLAVDGVLLIGEHGKYPYNKKGQHLYPRRRFFDETVKAFKEAGEVVPIFNDKHLAAEWEDAKHMYETAKKLKIPFQAGSSLPLAWRLPHLEIPREAIITEAMSVGYGGVESYGFHALETLQCMVERRRGGETGVTAVTCLQGNEVWKAMEEGKFSKDLLEAALSRHHPSLKDSYKKADGNTYAFIIEYRDGLKASVIMLPYVRDFLFSAKLKDYQNIVSTQFWLQEPTWGHFSFLSNALSEMVIQGRAVYPVERTVITTGIVDAVMDSRFEKGKRIETPDLNLSYKAQESNLGAFHYHSQLTSRSGGWVDLFDGKSLDGWLVHDWEDQPKWEVKDGILRATGGKGYVSTTETFSDFELFAQVRISDPVSGRGNSGIYFRCQPHINQKQEYPPGYEAQCDNGDKNNPSGSIYNLGMPGSKAPDPKVKDGEWFTVRILAVGNHLRTWINGNPAADCKDSQNRYREGTILLQQHHKTGVTEFKQVRIRRLKPAFNKKIENH